MLQQYIILRLDTATKKPRIQPNPIFIHAKIRFPCLKNKYIISYLVCQKESLFSLAE